MNQGKYPVYDISVKIDDVEHLVDIAKNELMNSEAFGSCSIWKSGRHAFLAEALITHGRALARLQRYGPSLSAFRRGIDLSEHTGNIKQAADASLAAFREISEHLSVLDSGQLISRREWGKDKHAREHKLIKL